MNLKFQKRCQSSLKIMKFIFYLEQKKSVRIFTYSLSKAICKALTFGWFEKNIFFLVLRRPEIEIHKF